MAHDLDPATSRAAIVWKEIDRCGGAHTRNRAHAFEHRAREGGSLRGHSVLRDRQGHKRGQHIFGVESGAGVFQANETSHQETCANQKHERRADFKGDHRLAQQAASYGRSARSFFERFREIDSRSFECGRDAEEHARGDRDQREKPITQTLREGRGP